MSMINFLLVLWIILILKVSLIILVFTTRIKCTMPDLPSDDEVTSPPQAEYWEYAHGQYEVGKTSKAAKANDFVLASDNQNVDSTTPWELICHRQAEVGHGLQVTSCSQGQGLCNHKHGQGDQVHSCVINPSEVIWAFRLLLLSMLLFLRF